MRRLPLLLAAGAIAAALVPCRPVPTGAAERDLGTGYQLENVQVLDPNMGLAEARRAMVAFNEALGVSCRDCHELRNFASDAEPLKLVARDMMKMTREINERWFPGRAVEAVSCMTCHQGQRIPPGGQGAVDIESLIAPAPPGTQGRGRAGAGPGTPTEASGGTGEAE